MEISHEMIQMLTFFLSLKTDKCSSEWVKKKLEPLQTIRQDKI